MRYKVLTHIHRLLLVKTILTFRGIFLSSKIASTNSSGLVMKPEMVVLKSLLKRNGLRRCLAKRVSNRLMMIKLQIDKRTVVVVSAYAPQ